MLGALFNAHAHDSNPEAYAQWWSVAAFFNGVGVLIKRGLLEIDLAEELLSNVTDILWVNMSPIIIEWRKTTRQKHREYELLHGFEYLYNEMIRIIDKKGHKSITMTPNLSSNP